MTFRIAACLFVSVQFSLFVLPSVAQSSAAQGQQWWYNFPSSPLKIEPTNADSSTMDLRRVSGDTIIGYRFGCLVLRDGHVEITKRLSLKNLSLKSDSDFFSSAILFKNDMRSCMEPKPLVAIVEVHFADGGVWSVAHESAEPNP